MAEQTRQEQPHPKTQATAAQPPLQRYARELTRQHELTELVLALEAVADGQGPSPEQQAHLSSLTQATGLSLNDAEAVREAIVVLGERSLSLRGAGSAGAPPIDERSPAAVADGLLNVLELTRGRLSDPAQRSALLREATDEALEVYQRNLPATTDAERLWWTELRRLAREQLLPGYERVAEALTAVEEHPIKGALLRSKALMAVLVAAPGLLSWPLPLPTPIVVGTLGAIGAFVVHPLWLEHLSTRIKRLGEAMAAQGPRLERLSGERPWTEEDFSVEAVAVDLWAVCDAERLAGRGSEAELKQAIEPVLDEAQRAFSAVSSRSERYFQRVRRMVIASVLPQLVQQGTWRDRWDNTFSAWLVDRPWAMSLATTLATLPFDWIASRVSPLPQVVDLTLMAALFAVAGYLLPRSIPGTVPARRALLEELKRAQDGVENLP